MIVAEARVTTSNTLSTGRDMASIRVTAVGRQTASLKFSDSSS